MSLLASPLILCLVLAADAPAPKWPVGKETTYVTGPLDEDGYIDYVAALNDRLGKGITPATNANVLIWKALGPTPAAGGKEMPAEFFKRMGMEEPPKDGAYFIRLGFSLKDHRQLDRAQAKALLDQEDRAFQRPWTPKDYPQLAEWLEANEKPLALVAEATRRPNYYNPVVTHWKDEKGRSLFGAVLPGAQRCRELASALIVRAMLRMGEGRFDDAWQDLLACHRLGRLIGRGGDPIEGLIGIAIDTIADYADLMYLRNANLTVQQVQDRLKDLQSLAPMPPYADKIDLFERFEYLQTVQYARRRGFGMLEALSGSGPVPPKPDADGEKALAAIDWAPSLREGNQAVDRLVAVMRLKDRADRERQLVALATSNARNSG